MTGCRGPTPHTPLPRHRTPRVPLGGSARRAVLPQCLSKPPASRCRERARARGSAASLLPTACLAAAVGCTLAPPPGPGLRNSGSGGPPRSPRATPLSGRSTGLTIILPPPPSQGPARPHKNQAQQLGLGEVPGGAPRPSFLGAGVLDQQNAAKAASPRPPMPPSCGHAGPPRARLRPTRPQSTCSGRPLPPTTLPDGGRRLWAGGHVPRPQTWAAVVLSPLSDYASDTRV